MIFCRMGVTVAIMPPMMHPAIVPRNKAMTTNDDERFEHDPDHRTEDDSAGGDGLHEGTDDAGTPEDARIAPHA